MHYSEKQELLARYYLKLIYYLLSLILDLYLDLVQV